MNAVAVVAASPAAVAFGAEAGLRLSDLRARVPGIAAFPEDPAADREVLAAIADWCERYTPFVAEDGDRPDEAAAPGRWPRHGLMLDMTGALHLFGGEAAFLADIGRRLERQGFHVVLGLAAHPGLARAMALHGPGGAVPTGAERQAARALPVRVLADARIVGDRAADDRPGLLADAVAGLELAGLRTVGAVIDQPRSGLAARFGRRLVDALDRLTAAAAEPISPRRPRPDLVAERRFAEPVTAEAAIADTLAALTHEVGRRLAEVGAGADRFEARFHRVDGQVRAVSVRSRPTRDADLILRLFGHRLAALATPLDPGFGLDMIRLEAHGRVRLDPEILSLDGRADAAHDLARLVDRLAARFGSAAVTRPAFRDSHIPERAAFWRPAQDEPDAPAAAPPGPARPVGEPPLRPLRLLARPDRLEVMAEIPDGPPLRFRWRRVLHEVVRAEGPERIAAEWWRDAGAATRDYFRVEDRAGRRFWLFRLGLYDRETAAPAWYMHGLFA